MRRSGAASVYGNGGRTYFDFGTGAPREFETEPGTSIRGQCHWQSQPRERPTLLLVHGLEGSSESAYMFGLAERAFAAGWNAVRLNQRNCGGTESLTPTLYHSGLSGDYRAVLFESFVMPWRLKFSPWKPTEAVLRTLATGSAGGRGQRK